MSSNPFTVSSPEMMDAAEMRRLYVPLAEDFEIDGLGHVFINGHRGCGKSMMLRLLAPDCKMLELKKPLKELPFISTYAPIKSTDLDITECERVKGQYAGIVLAEHSLSLFLASKILQSLKWHTADALNGIEAKGEIHGFLHRYVFGQLKLPSNKYEASEHDRADPLQDAIDAIDTKYGELIDYFRQLSLAGDSDDYKPFAGRVVGYREFLFPLCANLTQLSCMPTGAPVYITIDDADNLNSLQTQILNTWVSYRTGNRVSFKISTQLGYKHYRTISNQMIETPHDFKEVNISTIYTGRTAKDAYPKWVEDIVAKRLSGQGIEVSAKSFFPVDQKQEAAIQAIKDKYKADWESTGRGYRPSDDATRYARPDYIKSLTGPSKQGHTYLYAGFEQLVHISSGIVRYFLDDAASMFAVEKKLLQSEKGGQQELLCIRPSVQDQVARESADALMIDNLDRLVVQADATAEGVATKDEFKQLRNLIQALGGIFQKILFSNRSERRVFSIALTDNPPDEVMKILKLAVKHGFLYESVIGTKEGLWRTRLFVMTRRLAPLFKLDPTGFAGYLFVTSELLGLAIRNPARAVREFEQKRLKADAEDFQLMLEFDK